MLKAMYGICGVQNRNREKQWAKNNVRNNDDGKEYSVCVMCTCSIASIQEKKRKKKDSEEGRIYLLSI